MAGLTATFTNNSGQSLVVNWAHVGIQGVGIGGGGGATKFVDLTDTPSALVAGKFLKVNADGTGLTQTDEPIGGATTHYFDGVPIQATGNDGDSGVNKITGSLYQKVAGAWVLQIHLTPKATHDALSDQANTIAALVTANTKLSEGGGPPVGNLNDAHLDDAGKLYIHDGTIWQLVADYATATEVTAAITAAIAGVTIDHVNSARFGFAQRSEDVAIAGMRYIVEDILDTSLGAEFAGKQNYFVVKDTGDNLTFTQPVLGEIVPLTLAASGNSDSGIEKTIFWTGTEWGRITDGYRNRVTGLHAWATGRENTASGANAVASGDGSSATASNAMAHGQGAVASGEESISLGRRTTASGAYSHATGNFGKSTGQYSHTGGNAAEARSSGSWSHGWAVTCKNAWAMLVGKFGVMGDPNTIFGIAHSASNNPPEPNQQNADEDLNLVMKVDKSGNVTAKGKYYIEGQTAPVGLPDGGDIGDVARRSGAQDGGSAWWKADALFQHLKSVQKVGNTIRFTGVSGGIEHTIDIIDVVGGNTVLSDGTLRIVDGVPPEDLGIDGDAAIDSTNGKIYKKEGGAWVEKVDAAITAELAAAIANLQSLVNLKADASAVLSEQQARTAADAALQDLINAIETQSGEVHAQAYNIIIFNDTRDEAQAGTFAFSPVSNYFTGFMNFTQTADGSVQNPFTAADAISVVARSSVATFPHVHNITSTAGAAFKPGVPVNISVSGGVHVRNGTGAPAGVVLVGITRSVVLNGVAISSEVTGRYRLRAGFVYVPFDALSYNFVFDTDSPFTGSTATYGFTFYDATGVVISTGITIDYHIEPGTKEVVSQLNPVISTAGGFATEDLFEGDIDVTSDRQWVATGLTISALNRTGWWMLNWGDSSIQLVGHYSGGWHWMDVEKLFAITAGVAGTTATNLTRLTFNDSTGGNSDSNVYLGHTAEGEILFSTESSSIDAGPLTIRKVVPGGAVGGSGGTDGLNENQVNAIIAATGHLNQQSVLDLIAAAGHLTETQVVALIAGAGHLNQQQVNTLITNAVGGFVTSQQVTAMINALDTTTQDELDAAIAGAGHATITQLDTEALSRSQADAALQTLIDAITFATRLASGTNLNSVLEPGRYNSFNFSAAGRPDGENARGTCLVEVTSGNSAGHFRQTYQAFQSALNYTRYTANNGAQWTEWVLLNIVNFSNLVGNVNLNTFVKPGRYATEITTNHPAAADAGGTVLVEQNAGGAPNAIRQTFQPTQSPDTYTRHTVNATANPVVWSEWDEVNKHDPDDDSVAEEKLTPAVRTKLNSHGATKMLVFEGDLETGDEGSSLHANDAPPDFRRFRLRENGTGAYVDLPTTGYHELEITVDTAFLDRSFNDDPVQDNPGNSILVFPKIDINEILALGRITTTQSNSEDWSEYDKIAMFSPGLVQYRNRETAASSEDSYGVFICRTHNTSELAIKIGSVYSDVYGVTDAAPLKVFLISHS